MTTRKVVSRLGHDDIMVEAQALQVLMHRYVPLQAALTSAAFNGDSFSTTAKTLIDLSVSFGAPAGIRAVEFKVGVNDSGSAGTDTYLILGPTNVAGQGLAFSPMPVDDRRGRYSTIVPCDANGDVYYQIVASGAARFDVYLQIWGYFI